MTLAALGQGVRARAAGLWRVDGHRLVQVEFWGAPDLASEVGREFATATREVPLERVDLGIVGAAVSASPCISIRADLPPDAGSAVWLGRFGADRSIAVPWSVDGEVVAVASVAIRGSVETEGVIDRVRKFLAAAYASDCPR